MKLILTSLAILISSFVISYLMLAFLTAQLNFILWTESQRGSCIYITAILSVVLALTYSLNEL
jgi:hypothetical protein